MPRITSHFNKSDEGWTIAGNGAFTHDAVNGLLNATDTGSGIFYFRGGDEWTGDLSSNFGGTLTYRVRDNATELSYLDEPDVRITGANGDVITFNFDQPTTAEFSTFRITLDQYSGWQLNDGPIATVEQIRAVLANVVSFDIRGEYRSGADSTDLTYARLTKGDLTDLDEPDVETGHAVWSTFDDGAEGWAFVEDVRTFRWAPTGGVEGGFLQAEDYVAGQIYYFVAPQKFLGQKAGFYGGTIDFQLITTNPGNLHFSDVVITGVNGVTLAVDAGSNPSTDWTPYSVDLDTSGGWRINTPSGAVATEADIRAVLADIDYMSFRGEFRSGAETTGIDNVFMTAPDARFAVVDPKEPGSVLFVGDEFLTAIDALEHGTDLIFRGTTSTLEDHDFKLRKNNVTIDADGDLIGSIKLAGRVRKFDMDGAGTEIKIVGNAQDNIIHVTNEVDDGERGFVRVIAGDGNDTIILNTLGDFRNSTAIVRGDAGNDTLIGARAGERLFGGDGDDTINGDAGRDILAGEAGADTFHFEGRFNRDRVLDFETGIDTIRIVGFNGIGSFDDLTFGSHRGHLTIEVDGAARIVLEGYTSSTQLDGNDFSFG